MSNLETSSSHARRHRGGHWGARPPLLRLVPPPQMKILQMGLHALRSSTIV